MKKLHFVYELDLEDRLLLRERMNKFAGTIMDDEAYNNALDSKIEDIEDLLAEVGLKYDDDTQSLVVYNELISDLDMTVLYHDEELSLINEDDREFILKLGRDEWNTFKIIDSELLYYDENTSIVEVLDVFDLLQLLHESEQLMFVKLYKQWIGSTSDLIKIMIENNI